METTADGTTQFFPYQGRRTLVPRGACRVFLINGIETTFIDASKMAERLSATLQYDVTLVYSRTEGFLRDLVEALEQKALPTDNLIASTKYLLAGSGAAPTLFQSVIGELRQSRSVWIYAHSRGAIYTSNVVAAVRALANSNQTLRRVLGLGWLDRFTLSDLKLLKVRTFGGAAVMWPPDINVRHYHITTDSVSGWIGMRDASARNTAEKRSDRLVETQWWDYNPIYLVDAAAIGAWRAATHKPDPWEDFHTLGYQWSGGLHVNFDASHNFVSAYMHSFFEEVRSDFAAP